MADAPASIGEVAADAGASVRTVSNVPNRPHARGVEDEASEPGLAVILCNSDGQQARETQYLELLEEHRLVVRRSSQARPGPAG